MPFGPVIIGEYLFPSWTGKVSDLVSGRYAWRRPAIDYVAYASIPNSIQRTEYMDSYLEYINHSNDSNSNKS